MFINVGRTWSNYFVGDYIAICRGKLSEKTHCIQHISIVKKGRGYVPSQEATQRIFFIRPADTQQRKRCPRRITWDNNTQGEREVTLAPLTLLEQLHFSFVHFNESQTGPGDDTNSFCSGWCHNLHRPRGRDAMLQPSLQPPASTSAGGTTWPRSISTRQHGCLTTMPTPGTSISLPGVSPGEKGPPCSPPGGCRRVVE